jgi:hypothetical protein
MEIKLKLSHILFAYKNLKNNRDNMSMFDIGKHLGYMEAGLHLYGYLETVKNEKTDTFVIKRETIKSNKWWKFDKTESMEQSIIRQVENMFTKNNIQF